MPDISVPAASLNPNLAYIGRLLGLFTGDPKGDLTLNALWFENPWVQIENAPNDPQDVLNLLGGADGNSGLLGSAAANFSSLLAEPGSNIPGTMAWFPVSVPAQAGHDPQPTGVHVVLPSDHTTSPAALGLGLAKTFSATDQIEITPFVYSPLFQLPIAGTPIVTGDATHPVEVGITIKDTKNKFQIGNIEFNGVALLTKIVFNGDAPTFLLCFYDDSTTPVKTIGLFDGLEAIASGGAGPWIDVVLAQSSVDTWLRGAVGATAQTPGALLAAIKLLADGTPYTLGDLGAFAAQTAADVLFDVLDLLATDSHPIVKIGSASVFVVSRTTGPGAVDYGLRAVMPDVKMSQDASEASDGNDALAATPGDSDSGPARELTLQLGKFLTGEDTNADAWITSAYPGWVPADPGIDLFVLRNNAGTSSFRPRLTLVSVGFDYAGAAGKQLVAAGGFGLAGVEARLYFDIDLSDSTNNVYGGVIRCDGLGLPIGTSFGAAGGDNPIASSLISSGSDGSPEPGPGAGGDAATGRADAVNPAFSMSAAYIDKGTFKFQLYDAAEKPSDRVMLPIQRTFGPLECQTIGIGWNGDANRLDLLFDGSVSLAGLSVDLVELTIGIPITDPTTIAKYQLDLQGLDVSFDGGPVAITGGLLKAGSGSSLTYDGQAFIKFETFAIGAIGSYATLSGGGTSLFIFAFVDYPLGGSPFLFVTGAAAGFGYNRSLVAPPRDQVTSFPLVAGVSNPAALNVTSGQAPDLGAVLSTLKDAVPPARGEYWVAAGVQFTSFDIIQSNILLIVEFGKEFEILILGVSTIKLPKAGTAYAYVELGIEITIKPDEGEVGATAMITPNSYVLDPACKLTGGFAFFTWFGSNAHAGDFVLTIGGYHPAFVVPAWYPTVPRLGFMWAVSDSVSIKGDAYFALTPSCVMAGGSLEALYSDGDLQAWFDAYADFLISWKPYFFSADIGVSIGISYRVHLLSIDTTIRIEIGADINLWGPPTGGKVHVHLWIVSFTVSFGSSLSAVETTTDWNGFKTMLPAAAAAPSRAARAKMEATAGAPDILANNIVASAGLRQTMKDGSWIVRPGSFTFAVSSTIPSTSVSLNGVDHTPTLPTDYFVGVRPMAVESLTSTLAVSVESNDTHATWTCTADLRDVPEAMWGAPVPGGSTPSASAKLLSDRLMGLIGVAPIAVTPEGPPPIVMDEAFQDVVIASAPLPLSQKAAPTGGVPSATPEALDDIAHIMDITPGTGVAVKRAALFAAFGQLGVNAGTNGSLAVMASNPYKAFQDSPLIGTPAAA